MMAPPCPVAPSGLARRFPILTGRGGSSGEDLMKTFSLWRTTRFKTTIILLWTRVTLINMLTDGQVLNNWNVRYLPLQQQHTTHYAVQATVSMDTTGLMAQTIITSDLTGLMM